MNVFIISLLLKGYIACIYCHRWLRAFFDLRGNSLSLESSDTAISICTMCAPLFSRHSPWCVTATHKGKGAVRALQEVTESLRQAWKWTDTQYYKSWFNGLRHKCIAGNRYIRSGMCCLTLSWAWELSPNSQARNGWSIPLCSLWALEGTADCSVSFRSV